MRKLERKNEGVKKGDWKNVGTEGKEGEERGEEEGRGKGREGEEQGKGRRREATVD